MAYLLTYISIIHFHLTQEKTARVKFFQQHIRKKYHICSEIFFKKLFRGKQKLHTPPGAEYCLYLLCDALVAEGVLSKCQYCQILEHFLRNLQLGQF